MCVCVCVDNGVFVYMTVMVCVRTWITACVCENNVVFVYEDNGVCVCVYEDQFSSFAQSCPTFATP